MNEPTGVKQFPWGVICTRCGYTLFVEHRPNDIHLDVRRELMAVHQIPSHLLGASRAEIEKFCPNAGKQFKVPGIDCPEIPVESWVCQNPDCGAFYSEYVNGCPKCWELNETLSKVVLMQRVTFGGDL